MAAALFALGGCASVTLPPTEPDGRFCHRAGKPTWHQVTCTSVAVPPSQAELAALPAEPGALTVYVLRGGWGDSRGRVAVAVNGLPVAESVPRSFVRLRLVPGRHRFAGQWSGGQSEIELGGAAGDVLFVALEPPGWSWQRPFAWAGLTADEARERVAAARLVADVDQRR